MLTKHAKVRMSQRSIPPFALVLLEEFGSEMRHCGANILFMDKAARRRLERAFGGRRATRMLEPLLKAYAVVERGCVLTMAHKTRRFRRDKSQRH